jgi:hypothetical protein
LVNDEVERKDRRSTGKSMSPREERRAVLEIHGLSIWPEQVEAIVSRRVVALDQRLSASGDAE